jgi:hypothetical protein
MLYHYIQKKKGLLANGLQSSMPGEHRQTGGSRRFRRLHSVAYGRPPASRAIEIRRGSPRSLIASEPFRSLPHVRLPST